MARIKAQGRDDIIGKVALGATGLALAAGGIAAAAMLANRTNRAKVRKVAGKTFNRLGKVRQALQDRADKYQAFTHKIGIEKGKAKKSKGKTQKDKKAMPAILHKLNMGKSKKGLKSKRGLK